ncbi:aromatic acid exporter family protein [Gorillibacterium timonense]|uniref:aromatic acid exporter family protein n=1 Tax=Gorillibacterium timonense TaxID=1689269 RepID=UPI00071C59D4|nr:aromatic acid exporter family protein [Gorillibacterium timonense]
MLVRVVKSSVAAAAAIEGSLLLGLSNSYTAGLFAILGIDTTKKRSVQSIIIRFIASVIGLLVATAAFYLLGYHVWVIGLYIFVQYLALYKMKMQDGIVMSSVIMLHLYAAGETTLKLIGNEVMLLAMGLGVAAIINLIYTPRSEKQMMQTKEAVEANFSAILREIAGHLRDFNRVWNGTELLTAMEKVDEGGKLAMNADENALFQNKGEWHTYFEMRRQQLFSIQRMLDLVSQVYQNLPHGEAVAELFDSLAEDLKNPYYTGRIDEELSKLDAAFKTMPLPENRREFEVRSALLQINLELKTFLSIAKQLKKKRPQGRAEALQ